MATLVIESSKCPTKTVRLLRPITTIGSSPENDIAISHCSLEPTHAHLERQNEAFYITGRLRDMTVNGRREKRVRLKDLDVIRIADIQLTFYIHDQEAPQTSHLSTQEVSSNVLLHQEVLKAYRRIHDFSLQLTEDASTKRLVTTLLDGVIELTGADQGFLVLFEEDKPVIRSARNVAQASLMGGIEKQLSDSILKRVRETKRPIMVEDALEHEEWSASASIIDLKLRSVLCVPLLDRGEVKGVIFVGHKHACVFSENALDVSIVFAAQACLLLSQQQHFEELTRQKSELETELATTRLGSIVGTCESMRNVLRRVRRVATTDVSVLITGETGTGKELIAREIHRSSHRTSGPFVVVNCGAIPENLLESELFGHVQGAFTGAISDRAGRFQAANGGTLFLDEIGEMPLLLQVKLLRALQEKIITPVGSDKDQSVDIRVIAATHRNLGDEVKEGRFRDDLYYRLDVVTIEPPPLRDRDSDLEILARYFLARESNVLKRNFSGFSTKCLNTMYKYRWPGNIRELENRVRKAIVMGEANEIEAEDMGLHTEHIEDVVPLTEAKERFQREYIQRILERNGGNRTRTAKDLGVDPRTIFRHLEKSAGAKS